jgi:catechol 2,3-dioxygenase-like lactoylglutathione lyase family enzyme
MVLAPPWLTGQSQRHQDRSVLPIQVTTLNHMTFPCADLPSSVAWYQKVFGMPIQFFQHFQGRAGDLPILQIGKGPEYIALSQSKPFGVAPAPRLPHFCWGMKDFTVDRVLRACSEMRVPLARAILREAQTPETYVMDPDGFPVQFQDESSCGGGGYLDNMCDSTRQEMMALRIQGDPPPIQVKTLNHVKLMVPNLKRSLEWYLKLTDMRIVAYQERDEGPRTVGYVGPSIPILRVGAGPQHLVFLEGTGPQAFRQHIGLGIEGFNADEIMKRLAAHKVVAQVRMREGVTPEVLLEAPDGVEIQLQDVSYCGGGGVLGNTCDPLRLPVRTSRG